MTSTTTEPTEVRRPLAGRRAIVVGASRGLGRGVAGALAGLGLTFTALMPRITPATDLGRPAVQAYAARAGKSEAEYLQEFGDPLTPEVAGAAVVELAGVERDSLAAAYLLTGGGLKAL